MSTEVPEWFVDEMRREGKRDNRPGAATCHHILQILDAEGMSDYAIAQVERYIRRCNTDRQRWQEMFEKARKDFAQFMATASGKNRGAVSAFIRHKCRQSMETGIRIGLAAALWNDIKGSEEDSMFCDFPESPDLPSEELNDKMNDTEEVSGCGGGI